VNESWSLQLTILSALPPQHAEATFAAHRPTLTDAEREMVERLRPLLTLPLDGPLALVGRASILGSDHAMNDA